MSMSSTWLWKGKQSLEKLLVHCWRARPRWFSCTPRIDKWCTLFIDTGRRVELKFRQHRSVKHDRFDLQILSSDRLATEKAEEVARVKALLENQLTLQQQAAVMADNLAATTKIVNEKTAALATAEYDHHEFAYVAQAAAATIALRKMLHL